jgi:hypothetical protein
VRDVWRTKILLLVPSTHVAVAWRSKQAASPLVGRGKASLLEAAALVEGVPCSRRAPSVLDGGAKRAGFAIVAMGKV